jgi:hydroxymethylbilane synthase
LTARLATHPDVAVWTGHVLERLLSAGVDVEFAGNGVDPEAASSDGSDGSRGPHGSDGADPLNAVRGGTIDLALVGIGALRGSAADGLTTVAVLPRGEVRDVVVGLAGRPAPLHALPGGARVGVVGARRLAFLRAHRPDVKPVPLSQPPLGVEAGGAAVDAAVISALEARQAGLSDATVEALDVKAWLPEPGQGILALVARHPIAEATALDHLPTRTALRTELALLDALEAGPDAPLGCVAQPSGRWIRLWAAAASSDGRRLVRSDRTGPLDEPEGLGAAVARQLVERGFGLVTASAG